MPLPRIIFLTAALTTVPRLLRCFAQSLTRVDTNRSANYAAELRALIDTYDTTLPTFLSHSRRAEKHGRCPGRLRVSRIRAPRHRGERWCERTVRDE